MPPTRVVTLDSRAGTGRRLTREAALYGIAGAVGKALALVTVPILSRALGPGEYGMADLAVGFASLVTLLVSFAGDMSAVRMRALASGDRERAGVLSSWIAATAVVSLVAAIALLPLATWIAGTVWNAPGETDLAMLSFALIPIAAVQAALASVPRVLGRPWAAAGVAILDLLAQVACAIGFVLLGWGPEGVVAGFIVGSAVGLIGAAAVAAPHLTGRPQPKIGIRVITLGAAFLPVGTVFIFTEYMVRFMLVETHGQTAVGQFAVAIRMASAMLLISAAFSLAWGPYGLSLHATTATLRLFARVLLAFGGLAIGVALVVGALSPELVILVSGVAYLPAAEALPGLVWGAATSGIFFILVVGAGIAGNSRAIPVAAFTGAIVQVLVSALSIEALGLTGVGFAAVCGRVISLGVLGIAIGPKLQIRPTVVVYGVASAVVALLLGIAGAAPDETRLVRLITAIVVVTITVSVLIRTRRSPFWDLRTPPNEKPPMVGYEL